MSGLVIGTFQRLTYGALSLTLDATAFHFVAGVGNNLLDRFGYDRWQKEEDLPSPFYGYSGATHFEANSYEAPYQFVWNLQKLTQAAYRDLRAIVMLSNNARQPVRLDDGLYALDEPAPRKRGRIESPAIPLAPATGTVLFWPRFDVVLSLPQERSLWSNGYSTRMSGVEYSPDQPVTGDVAA